MDITGVNEPLSQPCLRILLQHIADAASLEELDDDIHLLRASKVEHLARRACSLRRVHTNHAYV
jgi:hypothetical protein